MLGSGFLSAPSARAQETKCRDYESVECDTIHYSTYSAIDGESAGAGIKVRSYRGVIRTLDPPLPPGFRNLDIGLEPPRDDCSIKNGEDPAAKVIRLVTLEEELHMPRFPEPAYNEPPNSIYNQGVLEESRQIVSGLLKKRKAFTKQVLADLPDSEYVVHEQFWLISSFVIETSRSNLVHICGRDGVRYLDLIDSFIPPLSDSTRQAISRKIQHALENPAPTSGKSVEDGRALIGTDPYYAIEELRGGWVGLLDTGVNFGHVLLKKPTSLDARADCVEGGPTCLEYSDRFDPTEACAIRPHGTSSAAILTGNSNLGPKYRGVTSTKLDSYRIYYCMRLAGANVASPAASFEATIRGFQAAVVGLNKVLLVEMQGTPFECQVAGPACQMNAGQIAWISKVSAEHGVASHAANKAYDAGSVVIATIGDGRGVPYQPGNGHRVLAVGSKPITSPVVIPNYGHGPTADGRIKPDIMANSSTDTANGITDISIKKHESTSGATPYVAGGATLLRNWLKRTSDPDTTGWRLRDVDPGQVYAQVILSGSASDSLSNKTGAGFFRMPPLEAHSFWGSTMIDSTRVNMTIPIKGDIGTVDSLSAALWWPESFGAFHNSITLELLDSKGTVRATSDASNSIFQRTVAAVEESPVGWAIRIKGSNLGDGPQVVYWAASAH